VFTKQRILNSFIGAALAVAALAAVAFWLAGLTPRWYQPPAANDPEAMALGETAEYRLVEEFQKIRPEDEVWRLRIPEDAINAWLGTRLPAWLEGRGESWPEELGTPQVRIRPSGIAVTAPTSHLGDRYAILTLTPAIQSGNFAGTIAGRIGRLPIPLPTSLLTGDLIGMVADTDELAFLGAACTSDPARAAVPLVDGRIISLQSIQLDQQSLVLTAITRPSGGATATDSPRHP